MTHRMQCCCGEEPCVECSTETTCFDTSYVIPNLDVTYTFSKQASNIRSCDDPQCISQGNCGYGGYDITCAIGGGALVLTRQGGAGTPCCYKWRGDLEVTYTITITEVRRCVGNNCPRTWSQTFTGTELVPACIDVVCLECTSWDACGQTFTTQAWMHTLRICSFAVDCAINLEGLIRPNQAGNPVCTGWYTQCDPQAAEPCEDCTIPRSIWCRGGAVTYISDRVALDAIPVMRCYGWRAGEECDDDCTVDDTWSSFTGPFSAVITEECDAQGPRTCLIPTGGQPPFYDFKTRFGDPTIDALLDTRCGSADFEVGPYCANVAYLQSACAGQGWTYA